MSDRALLRLAKAAGLSARWTDAHGTARVVSPETLRVVLGALGHPAESRAQVAESLKDLDARAGRIPPLTVIPHRAPLKFGDQAVVRVTAEDGDAFDVETGVPTTLSPGYYRVEIDGEPKHLAVAPQRAKAIENGRKLWATAAQLYALRGRSAADFGDFAALGSLAAQAAAVGADGVAISPVHALFGACPSHISPYSPSTRLFFNPLYIAVPNSAASKATLIDWVKASQRKRRALRKAYLAFKTEGDTGAFQSFVKTGGERLLAHARFEVLDARFRAQGLTGWRNWPAEWRSASSPAVLKLAAADPDVEFELYLQWQAGLGLGGAQAEARSSGMSIGLIADMAVGVDPDGSLAWSAPGEMLNELQVGAPPDIFNTTGQNWGLTTFSPDGLRDHGYDGFIATLRAAMRHAGGVRLDHAMGLQRLWVVPRGASPAEGVYLDYPKSDMMRLIALESVRHDCLVVAEDLGTVPAGFRRAIAEQRFYGMRVLWFERSDGGGFTPPDKWDRDAAALSTTHDLPTIAGWWSGRDIAWRRKLGLPPAALRRAESDRARDRKALWRALKSAGCAEGKAPAPATPSRAIDGAIAYLAMTACPLAIIPVEDFIGEREQPNIPGTIDEHPNWRRRMKTDRPFAGPSARRRAAILRKSRTP